MEQNFYKDFVSTGFYQGKKEGFIRSLTVSWQVLLKVQSVIRSLLCCSNLQIKASILNSNIFNKLFSSINYFDFKRVRLANLKHFSQMVF